MKHGKTDETTGLHYVIHLPRKQGENTCEEKIMIASLLAYRFREPGILFRYAEFHFLSLAVYISARIR